MKKLQSYKVEAMKRYINNRESRIVNRGGRSPPSGAHLVAEIAADLRSGICPSIRRHPWLSYS